MQGDCNNGICNCYDGFVGDDCSIQDCPKDCYKNGIGTFNLFLLILQKNQVRLRQ
jgi:hypothetical protein